MAHGASASAPISVSTSLPATASSPRIHDALQPPPVLELASHVRGGGGGDGAQAAAAVLASAGTAGPTPSTTKLRCSSQTTHIVTKIASPVSVAAEEREAAAAAKAKAKAKAARAAVAQQQQQQQQKKARGKKEKKRRSSKAQHLKKKGSLAAAAAAEPKERAPAPAKNGGANASRKPRLLRSRRFQVATAAAMGCVVLAALCSPLLRRRGSVPPAASRAATTGRVNGQNDRGDGAGGRHYTSFAARSNDTPAGGGGGGATRAHLVISGSCASSSLEVRSVRGVDDDAASARIESILLNPGGGGPGGADKIELSELDRATRRAVGALLCFGPGGGAVRGGAAAAGSSASSHGEGDARTIAHGVACNGHGYCAEGEGAAHCTCVCFRGAFGADCRGSVNGQWVGKLVELAAKDEGGAASDSSSGGGADWERGIGAGGHSFGGGISLDSDIDAGWGSPIEITTLSSSLYEALWEDVDSQNSYPPAPAPGHM